MSDIVKLRNNGCQAGCREDGMKGQTATTLARHLRIHRGADATGREAGAVVTIGSGIWRPSVRVTLRS
jgi:hypothetical protein